MALGDAVTVAAPGLCGYRPSRIGCDPALFLLGIVLGPMREGHGWRAMPICEGNGMLVFERPIRAGLRACVIAALRAFLPSLAAAVALPTFLPSLFEARTVVFSEAQDQTPVPSSTLSFDNEPIPR